MMTQGTSPIEKENLKEFLLKVIELQLEYQLQAIRQLQGKTDLEPTIPRPRGRRRQSLVDLSINLLTEKQKPLHVNDLVQLLQQHFGRLTDRDTLSSALSKKARQGILVKQIAPATFSLIKGKEKNHVKT
jgi:hypothetical protein